MTHREDCESYLKGLIGTRNKIIHWKGDTRSKPKVNIPKLIKEISRIKSILAVFPPSCPSSSTLVKESNNEDTKSNS